MERRAFLQGMVLLALGGSYAEAMERGRVPHIPHLGRGHRREGGIAVVENMAELLQTKGRVAYLRGYYTPGDGGEGFFIFSPDVSKELHDGGTIIDPLKEMDDDWFTPTNSGNGCWVRVFDQLKVNFFGATRDGSRECSKEIEKAIEVAQRDKFSTLHFDRGIYKVDGLVIKDNVNISLVGEGATWGADWEYRWIEGTIIYNDSTPQPTIYLEGTHSGIHWSNIRIAGNSSQEVTFKVDTLYNNCSFTNFFVKGYGAQYCVSLDRSIGPIYFHRTYMTGAKTIFKTAVSIIVRDSFFDIQDSFADLYFIHGNIRIKIESTYLEAGKDVQLIRGFSSINFFPYISLDSIGLNPMGYKFYSIYTLNGELTRWNTPKIDVRLINFNPNYLVVADNIQCPPPSAYSYYWDKCE
jgi:hypothetical protein